MNALVPVEAPPKNDNNIEQSLNKAAEFLRGYKAEELPVQVNVLDGIYEIDLNTPLPQFNAPNAKAYAATDLNDSKAVFALICNPSTLQRHQTIDQMLTLRHPSICSIMASGTVQLSQPNEERYVIICEQLKGHKLSDILARTKYKIPPQIIADHIIKPIVHGLVAMEEAGVVHGCINLDNIYYDNTAIIGPCVTEPCGYSQHYYYELVERMQCDPAGKGEMQPGIDFYALGVMILEIITDKASLTRLPPENLARRILRQGPFMALTGARDVPEEFFDFLWGMLGSGVNQRWNYRYLKPWLEGKHYNIIPSQSPSEGSKPYECLGTTAHSRREVAHLMRTHWGQVKETLMESSLAQWLLMTLRKKELSELAAHHVKTIVETGARNEQLRNEHIMRLILALDNQGPLSYVNIHLHVDSIPALVTDLFIRKEQDKLESLLTFITQNHVSSWSDLQHAMEVEIPEKIVEFFMKLDRSRSLLRNTSMGFGVARLMYDLNPQLPCLSPLCKGKHITKLIDLMVHLDNIAPQYASSQDPLDEHIAAFMASKLLITTEIKLHDLSLIPDIASNQALIALKLFAVAQHRAGNIELNGLTHWVVQRAVPVMQHLHSETMRSRTLQMMLEKASEGRTQFLGDLLLDGEIVNADSAGFQKASTNYRRNAERIEAYQKGLNLEHDSAQLGYIIAKIFAYAALLMSVYNIFMAYQ